MLPALLVMSRTSFTTSLTVSTASGYAPVCAAGGSLTCHVICNLKFIIKGENSSRKSPAAGTG